MAADGGDDIFVYLGGDQEVPDEITHAIIDPPSILFEGRHLGIANTWYQLYFMTA